MVDVVGGGGGLFTLSTLDLHVFVAHQGVHGDEVACRDQGLDGPTQTPSVQISRNRNVTSTQRLIETATSPEHGTDRDMESWRLIFALWGGLGLGLD